jgi:predicted nucleic acid-binding protein
LIALDTNILVYADTANDPLGRHDNSVSLIETLSASGDACIPLQVLGEFLNVCRHKKVLDLDLAAERAKAYAAVFETPQTCLDDMVAANALLSNYNLQYFDALIITVAARAGATMLLSEDMQDGLEVAGLRVVNPFLVGGEGLMEQAVSNT